jgi:hypothetical protein
MIDERVMARLQVSFVMLACAACIDLGFAQQACGQIPYRYSPPAGRTLTPYLNFFRQDVGVLDPYNAFIVPQRDLEYRLKGLGAAAQRQQAEIQTTQHQLNRIYQSGAAPTGTGGRFMNYGGYYRSPIIARPR